jgi:hypothetical protein
MILFIIYNLCISDNKFFTHFNDSSIGLAVEKSELQVIFKKNIALLVINLFTKPVQAMTNKIKFLSS